MSRRRTAWYRVLTVGGVRLRILWNVPRRKKHAMRTNRIRRERREWLVRTC